VEFCAAVSVLIWRKTLGYSYKLHPYIIPQERPTRMMNATAHVDETKIKQQAVGSKVLFAINVFMAFLLMVAPIAVGQSGQSLPPAQSTDLLACNGYRSPDSVHSRLVSEDHYEFANRGIVDLPTIFYWRDW
jgi:hypothetical protein